MPLNSYQCAKCGKHNNYVVELDEERGQEVQCSMCGTSIYLSESDLPERVLESIQQLEQDQLSFDSSAQVRILNDDESIVDELLDNMEKTFKSAKENLVIDGANVKMDLNINAIADAYAPIKGAVDEKSEKLVESMMGSSQQTWQRDAAVAAASKASEYIDDGSMTGRVLGYITNALKSGASVSELLNKQSMQAAGLSKKEIFVLDQLAKSNKLNEIVAQYLGESF